MLHFDKNMELQINVTRFWKPIWLWFWQLCIKWKEENTLYDFWNVKRFLIFSHNKHIVMYLMIVKFCHIRILANLLHIFILADKNREIEKGESDVNVIENIMVLRYEYITIECHISIYWKPSICCFLWKSVIAKWLLWDSTMRLSDIRMNENA